MSLADIVEGITVSFEAFDVNEADGKFVGVSVGFEVVGGDVRLAKIPGGNRCEKDLPTDGKADGDEEGTIVGLFVGMFVGLFVGSELGLVEGFRTRSEGPSDGIKERAGIGLLVG